MSFLTDLTPATVRATCIAVASFAAELTNPLNWTTPLNVSTLISADLSVGSLKIAALTLPVMTVSSTYSPVPSCFAVEAQPSARLLWTITERQSTWSSVSRAVRTPTLQEDDSVLRRGPSTTLGNSRFDSEKMVAFEVGYRNVPAPWLTVDVAGFYNDYDQLASLERITPTTILRANKLTGTGRGVELSEVRS